MTAMPTHLVGRVRSGDAEIFYRRFGSPGRVPLLILHGANYYDSADWVGVASQLAEDREVVSCDHRGYGESSWSPSRDYSLEATLDDIENLLTDLNWRDAVLIGHSRGGLVALRFGHRRPERIAGVVLVDYSPGQITGRSRIEPVGPLGQIYASLEEAHAATSRDPSELQTSSGRARAEAIFGKRHGGWANVRRDPAFQNNAASSRPAAGAVEPWDAFAELTDAGIALHVVRGMRSTSYDETALLRLRNDFAAVGVSDVDSGHDVPGAAPDELVIAIRGFLDSRADELG